MLPTHTKKMWLPYFVAILGLIISFAVWYALKQENLANFDLFNWIERYHSGLVLLVFFVLSFLAALIVGIAQVSSDRARSLKIMNENLTKEIADRMSAEETKQKLEVALLQGQKLQAIGTLAGGIAHDFNNILYAIMGYIELAKEDVPKDSLVYKNLGKVLEAGKRGQELISRILAFSRRQHHEFNNMELKSTIEAALALLRPTIPASVSISFKPEFDGNILGNQTQIHQILVNFINNAVDAMDGEGTIIIQLTRVSRDHIDLKEFPDTLSQNYCKIEISDTGHGMDRATMERIFEPFFTTKEVGKGTGLGLSIVHTIIKEHQGEITVSSRLGHGTIFKIFLPEFTGNI